MAAAEIEPIWIGHGYNISEIDLQGDQVDFQAYPDTTIVDFYIYDTDVENDNRTFTVTFNDGTIHNGYINTTVTIPFVSSNSIYYFDGYFVNSTNAIPFSLLPRNMNGQAVLGISASSAGFKNITIYKGGFLHIPYDIDLLSNGIKRVQISSSAGINFRSHIEYIDLKDLPSIWDAWGQLWQPEMNLYDRLNSIVGYAGVVISIILAILDLIFIQGVLVLFIILIELGFTAYSANNSKDVFMFFKKWINFNVKFFNFLIDMLVASVSILVGILNTINPLKWLIP